MTNTISVIIPTLNAERFLPRLFDSLAKQSLPVDEIIVIDSSSDDATAGFAGSAGARVMSVEREAFDHGIARTLAGRSAAGDVLIYVTQDIIPADDSTIEKLIKPLTNDDTIGACYGRQLPYPDASPSAAHLRFFNYPARSWIRNYNDRHRYGIKTAFLSNSFAAYRKNALERIGWFKNDMIMGEDVYAGAKLLQSGYQIAYVAEARVYHSHSYTLCQEFKRYFDIGVFHEMERWILAEFGTATGEGIKYIKSELAYLASRRRYHLVPQALVRTGLKFIGYQLGRNYDKISLPLRKSFSMHRNWWSKGKKL